MPRPYPRRHSPLVRRCNVCRREMPVCDRRHTCVECGHYVCDSCAVPSANFVRRYMCHTHRSGYYSIAAPSNSPAAAPSEAPLPPIPRPTSPQLPSLQPRANTGRPDSPEATFKEGDGTGNWTRAQVDQTAAIPDFLRSFIPSSEHVPIDARPLLENTEELGLVCGGHVSESISIDFSHNYANYRGSAQAGNDIALQQAAVITIGDLHANTLTLIIILIKAGILYFHNPNDYITVRDIIVRSTGHRLSFQTYDRFRQTLSRATKYNGKTIRLIGDILGDRMSNDALTLALIGFLRSSPNPVRIISIFSNHDENFIRYLTTPFDALSHSGYLGGAHTSLDRFVIFMKENYRQAHSVSSDINAYLSCIALFDIEASSTEGNVVLFTHTCIQPQIFLSTLTNIFSVGRDFIPGAAFPSDRVSISDFSLRELEDARQTSNLILNRIFMGVHSVWHDYIVNKARGVPAQYPTDNRFIWAYYTLLSPTYDRDGAFYLFLWLRIRARADLDVPCAPPLPFRHILSNDKTCGYRVHNIHGHDLNTREGSESLDHIVGKGGWEPNNLTLFLTMIVREPDTPLSSEPFGLEEPDTPYSEPDTPYSDD